MMDERGLRLGTGCILRSYLRSTSANMAIMTAIALPALLGVLGLASDYAQFSSKRSELQGAADKAALAAAKELSLATSSDATIEAAAKSLRKAKTVVVGTPVRSQFRAADAGAPASVRCG